MRTVFAIFAIALFFCLPVFGQDEETEVVLPDVVLKQVVQRIVIEHFKSKRGGEILFAEREIKPT